MRLALAATAALAPFSCSRPATQPNEDGPGMISVEWGGAAEGRFVAPGMGRWCPADSLLEITAISGDTGVAIALVAEDTIKLGQHPVVLPSVSVDWRPQARAALRWIGENQIQGFEATGGNVHVTGRQGGAVTGRLDVRMAAQQNPQDTVRLTGTFTRIPMEPDRVPCGRVAKGQP